MSYSLSLIACPAKSPLLHDDVDLASRAAAEAGAEVGAGEWLSPGEAWHVEFAGPPVAVRDRVRAALSQRALDINAFPAGHLRKGLLLADMDSTLIQQECIDELAAEIGLGAQVAAITERAMRGEIAFEPALCERVRLLEGLPTDTVSRVIAERIVLMPGAMTLVTTMRAAGAYTALVSGGFTVFAEPIGKRLNIHEYRANQLVAMAGRFTGTLVEPILGREAKADTLRELTARLGLDLQDTLAVGDGANDEAMIQLAGLGVAFRAKPALRLVAPTTVEHGDLTALLFLQGYRREEFVTNGEAS